MDAELVCVDYLNASNLGATAYYDVPNPRPTSLSPPKPFVVVERTGGPRGEGGTSVPMLDLQCWAPSRGAAAMLAQAVEHALDAMPACVENVAGVDITSTFRDRDLESGTPRYHVVCQLYSNV